MNAADGAGVLALALSGVNLFAIGLTAWRCRQRPPAPSKVGLPPVSIIRPVRGADPLIEETLRSTFNLAYPSFEVLFCVADASDPVAALTRRLIEAHPNVPATLLVGDDAISANPKLNNCVKGWRAAKHRWIVMADANVLLPTDYIQRLLSRWRPDTGIVCSPPIVSRPKGFFAELECAFMNTHATRWQFAAEAIGFGFAQGKTMMWRRDTLDNAGGIEALAAEPAEDAAATKVARSQGLKVQLADAPFEQPIGRRGFGDVWARQTRWARLRRATFPLCYSPEILTGNAVPMLLAAWWAHHYDYDPGMALAAMGVIAWGGEALLARFLGWPFTWRMLSAFALRDLLLPALWVDAWLGDDFVWHGSAMSVREGSARDESNTGLFGGRTG